MAELKDGIDSLMIRRRGQYSLPLPQPAEVVHLQRPRHSGRMSGAPSERRKTLSSPSLSSTSWRPAGKDPFEFRRDLLTEAAACTELDRGRERRIGESRCRRARLEGLPSRFPTAATPPRSPRSRSKRTARCVSIAWSAVDCGTCTSTRQAIAQMEGGIVYGLTAALYGAITIDKGRVQQSNFHDYPMLRINETPGSRSTSCPQRRGGGGIGEPGAPPIAPGVANAIFAATGKRIRNCRSAPKS